MAPLYRSDPALARLIDKTAAAAGESSPAQILVRRLGQQPYTETFAAMRAFTEARTDSTPDELWFLEHPPVFTQGQAGKSEHVLDAGDIPIVQSNRGGQVTYHGLGQLVVYVLIDLQRRGYGVRSLVTRLEQSMIALLAGYGIVAQAHSDAPGVYVSRAQWPDGAHNEQRKIGSLGLRVSRSCSYHGMALNIAMDLEPFGRINPCGLRGMRMTQIEDLVQPDAMPSSIENVASRLAILLQEHLAMATGFPPARE